MESKEDMQTIKNGLVATIRAAAGKGQPVHIRGGGSKGFYGSRAMRQHSDVLETLAYSGIIDYEPTELVVTARAGTRLADLEQVLAEHGQMLAFEPPCFGGAATLGGCVATGLSGPRRASAGSVRDFVLGVRMLDGRGEELAFGGRVMKNVAGYDLSRVMVGAMGTLGLLLDISVRVSPKPAAELTLRMPVQEVEAIHKMNVWAGQPLPVSATCFVDGSLSVRLSGAEPAVRAAQAKLGGEEIIDGAAFWESVREQTYVFFQAVYAEGFRRCLWRISVQSTTPPLALPGKQLIEWGGALRWFMPDAEDPGTDLVREIASASGGHATLFRSNNVCATEVFQPLSSGMQDVHRGLKEKFDPQRIYNPGCLYSWL